MVHTNSDVWHVVRRTTFALHRIRSVNIQAVRTANPKRIADQKDQITTSAIRTFSRLGLAASEGAVTGRISAEQLRKVVRMIVSPWMVEAAETSLKQSKRS